MKRRQLASRAMAGAVVLLALVWPSLPVPLGASAAVLRADAVSIAVEPSTASAAVGQSLAVDLRVNAGAQQVDSVELFVDFNPAVLQVVDAAGHPVPSINPGTVLQVVRENRVDAGAGRITFNACCPGRGSAAAVPAGSGSFVAAIVRFKAVAAGVSPVTFAQSGPRTTAVYGEDKPSAPASNILTTARGGMITVASGGAGAPTATDAPTLAGPEDGATVTDLAPLLRWSNPPGTTQYQVQVLPHNGDGPGINLIRNADTSYQVEAPLLGRGAYTMLPGMSYSWRVRTTASAVAVSEHDPVWGLWATRTFRTAPPSPAGIRAAAPANGSTVATVTPHLVWVNAAKNVFYYEVQVSADPQFNADPATATAAVYWNLVHGGQTAPYNSYSIPASFPLDSATTYHWRVRPRVQGDGTPAAWTPAWTFRTPAIVEADLKNPRNSLDHLGPLHNAGLDYVKARMADILTVKTVNGSAELDLEATERKLLPVVAAYVATIRPPLTGLPPTTDIPPRAFAGKSPAEMIALVQSRGVISEAQAAVLLRYAAEVEKAAADPAAVVRLTKQYENEVAAGALPDGEKSQLFAALAVGKSSALYWHGMLAGPTTWPPFCEWYLHYCPPEPQMLKAKWWQVLIADALGGVLGGVATGGAGVIPGAVAISSIFAITVAPVSPTPTLLDADLANPANPLDYLGRLHNQSLDYAAARLPEIVVITTAAGRGAQVDREATERNLIPVMEAFAATLTPTVPLLESARDLPTVASVLDVSAGDQITSLQSRGSLNEAQAVFLLRYVADVEQAGDDLAAIVSATRRYENELAGNAGLSETQKAPLYAGLSVGKSSALYWSRVKAAPSSQWHSRNWDLPVSSSKGGPMKWWLADAIGAVVGFVGGGVVGAVVIGGACSLGASLA